MTAVLLSVWALVSLNAAVVASYLGNVAEQVSIVLGLDVVVDPETEE